MQQSPTSRPYFSAAPTKRPLIDGAQLNTDVTALSCISAFNHVGLEKHNSTMKLTTSKQGEGNSAQDVNSSQNPRILCKLLSMPSVGVAESKYRPTPHPFRAQFLTCSKLHNFSDELMPRNDGWLNILGPDITTFIVQAVVTS